MVIYSANRKANDGVFHQTDCYIIARIKRENRCQYNTHKEARDAGLRMCNVCSPLARRLRTELPEITHFVETHGIAFRLIDNTLQIISRHGEWKIIVVGRRNTLFLYHKNQRASKFSDFTNIPGYHSQAVRSKTILGYLEYIASHDIYWETERLRQREVDRLLREQERDKQKLAKQAYREQYASKPENKKRAELRQNTRTFQRGTKNQHYSANQLYSVLDIKHKK